MVYNTACQCDTLKWNISVNITEYEKLTTATLGEVPAPPLELWSVTAVWTLAEIHGTYFASKTVLNKDERINENIINTDVYKIS